MKNNDVLILTASYGMGHNSVSKAVKTQILNINPNINIQIIDILDILNPAFKKSSMWMYQTLTKSFPKLYNILYDIKKEEEKNIFDETVYKIYLEKVKDYITQKEPQLVISTFPMCSGFISRIKHKYNIQIPMITIITDVVDSMEWIHDDTDMYFVPSKKVQESLIKRGISGENIRVTGIPVKEEFLQECKDKNKDKKILIMASAMGKLGIDEEFLSKLDKLDRKTIIVTGSNKILFDKLVQKDYNNIEIIGYAHNVSELMEQSILLVTKPGGVTLFESINKGIPMIIKNSSVGQEQANVEFIKEKGIGILVEEDHSLIDVISSSINNISILKNIQKNINNIKNEIESRKVGHFALELIS